MVSFHFGEEVAFVLDNPLALLGEIFHEGYFFEEVLVLVIRLDFDLFEGVNVGFDFGGVDVGVASAYLLFDVDVLEGVIALHVGVVVEKIVHLYCLLLALDCYAMLCI